jgi:hypothetical protein
MMNRGSINNAQRSAALQRWAAMIALGAGITVLSAKAETPTFSTVITPDMDTARINQAIKGSPSKGAVYFKAGVYNLTGPLTLIGGRTYIGAGSQDPSTPSVLKQTLSTPDGAPGVPIFSVQGTIFSVTIEGLTFDAAAGVTAKAIGGVDQTALLAIAAIRNNHFLSGLTECIDVPMILTWVDGNYFGERGSSISNKHRHIHSVYAAAEDQTNANWVVNNVFSGARGSESVLFEAGLQLNVRNNVFKNNDAAATLQISGMFQVVLTGNRFEGNRGDAIMRFANSRHSGLTGTDGAYKNGNYIVRARGNYYDMQRCATVCTNVHNKFIFLLDMNNDNGYVSKTQVYMGDESGTHFAHADGSLADLTDSSIAKACSGPAGIYLVITGPFNMPDYKGTQTRGCP